VKPERRCIDGFTKALLRNTSDSANRLPSHAGYLYNSDAARRAEPIPIREIQMGLPDRVPSSDVLARSTSYIVRSANVVFGSALNRPSHVQVLVKTYAMERITAPR